MFLMYFQNENDPTILNNWRIQAHSSNITDILMRLHWNEQNYVGYKKLLAQVRYKHITKQFKFIYANSEAIIILFC